MVVVALVAVEDREVVEEEVVPAYLFNSSVETEFDTTNQQLDLASVCLLVLPPRTNILTACQIDWRETQHC